MNTWKGLETLPMSFKSNYKITTAKWITNFILELEIVFICAYFNIVIMNGIFPFLIYQTSLSQKQFKTCPG